jgi:hypothetical protein
MLKKFHSIISVPQETPVQTVNIPLPTGGFEMVFLVVFGLSELLPFLGGRFKKYNGAIQSVVRLIGMLKPFRKEDEAVAKLKADLEAMKQTINDI